MKLDAQCKTIVRCLFLKKKNSSPWSWRLQIVLLIIKLTQEETRHKSLEPFLKIQQSFKKEEGRKKWLLLDCIPCQRCVLKCVTVRPHTKGSRKMKHIHPLLVSADALVGGLESTLSRSSWRKRAARHLVFSSVCQEAPRETARACGSVIGNRVPLLRVWYSAAAEGDCLLSCLLNGIIRAGGCGSGLAGNNNPGPGATSLPSGQMKTQTNKSTATEWFLKATGQVSNFRVIFSTYC